MFGEDEFKVSDAEERHLDVDVLHLEGVGVGGNGQVGNTGSVKWLASVAPAALRRRTSLFEILYLAAISFTVPSSCGRLEVRS